MLIRLNKISQILFMAAFAASLLSILDPNTNYDPSLRLMERNDGARPKEAFHLLSDRLRRRRIQDL